MSLPQPHLMGDSKGGGHLRSLCSEVSLQQFLFLGSDLET